MIAGQYPVDVFTIVVASLLHVLSRMLDIFWWCILIVIIASFVAQGSNHPVLGLLQQITEPLLRPARRIIPPLGGFDFSPHPGDPCHRCGAAHSAFDFRTADLMSAHGNSPPD